MADGQHIECGKKWKSILLQRENCTLRWYGHVKRMADGQPYIFGWGPAVKRKRDRPCTKFKTHILGITNARDLMEGD